MMKTRLLSFVLLSLLLIGGWKFFQYQRQKGTEVYYVYFENVEGVQPSSKVRIQGVPIGKIEQIQLTDPYRVHLTLRIDDKISIREGSLASLANEGMNGEKLVDIILGDGDSILKPGSILGSRLDSNLLPLHHRMSPILETARFLLASSEAGLRGFHYALNSGLIRGAAQGLMDIEDQLMDLEENIDDVLNPETPFIEVIQTATSQLAGIRSSLGNKPFLEAEAQTKSLSEQTQDFIPGDLLGRVQSGAEKLAGLRKENKGDPKLISNPEIYRGWSTQIKKIKEDLERLDKSPNDSLPGGS